MLSNQHRQLHAQFIEYRTEAEKLISERSMIYDNWLMFERAHMLRSPTFEVEYAHDERSPLGLYDCLIPKLREHRKLCLPPEI